MDLLAQPIAPIVKEEFPKAFIIGYFEGIRAGYCKECHLVFIRSVDAYGHWEDEHLITAGDITSNCEKKSKRKSE